MKVITIEAGTTTFIMVRDGDHFILGTTHGITVVGTVPGLTVACTTHGFMDTVVCTEDGTDGIVFGATDMADGTILGIMEDTMAVTMVTVMVDMDTVAVMATDSMMDITVA